MVLSPSSQNEPTSNNSSHRGKETMLKSSEQEKVAETTNEPVQVHGGDEDHDETLETLQQQPLHLSSRGSLLRFVTSHATRAEAETSTWTNSNAENVNTNSAQEQQRKQPQASKPKQLRMSSNVNNNTSNGVVGSSSQNFREARDQKVVGLKNYGLSKSTYAKRQNLEHNKTAGGGGGSTGSSMHSRRTAAHTVNNNYYNYNNNNTAPTDGSVFSLPPKSIEELEDDARKLTLTNPFYLLWLGNTSALKVMAYFLVTWETVLTCILTAGLTCFWYFSYQNDPNWNGGSLDFILLAFAVISPISAALGMAFMRRERALIAIADFRSFAYHLYLAHAMWDWPENGGRAGAAVNQSVNWIEHCDAVLAQLIGLGDELSRFLSLPTATKSRHRMTRQGRREAARIMEVSYHLLESMCTQRMTRLMFYSERIKKIGLPAGEVSRIRQYERFLSNMLEQLRMVKLYRTPQTLRSFARVFTLLLPPFYAPAFAQVARDVQSLGIGISFGIIVALGLSALVEGLEILEDPFTAYLALDGIDVREEFEVLHFAQLLSTRRLVFPDAPAYPPGRRAALIGYSSSNANKRHLIGLPPIQVHHERYHHSRVPSQVNLSAIAAVAGTTTSTTTAIIMNDDNTTIAADDDDDDEEETVTEFDLDDHVDMELGTTLMGEDDGSIAGIRRETAFTSDGRKNEDDDDATVRTRPRSHSQPRRPQNNKNPSLSASARLSRRRGWEQQQQRQQQQPAQQV